MGSLLLACQSAATLTGDRITTIENVTVIDAVQGQQDTMTVLIIDDRIHSVSKAPIGSLKAKTITRLINAGVPILAGTDTPIACLTPGASLHEELVYLVEAGLTPLEALRAATYAPAAFFGIEDQIESITKGKKAYLVLLNANPLDSIRNAAEIETVIKNGHVLDRKELDKRLSAPSKLTVS